MILCACILVLYVFYAFHINMNYRFKSVKQQEAYVDSNSNGVYDAGEDFTDLNDNLKWNYYHDYYNNYSIVIDMRYSF